MFFSHTKRNYFSPAVRGARCNYWSVRLRLNQRAYWLPLDVTGLGLTYTVTEPGGGNERDDNAHESGWLEARDKRCYSDELRLINMRQTQNYSRVEKIKEDYCLFNERGICRFISSPCFSLGVSSSRNHATLETTGAAVNRGNTWAADRGECVTARPVFNILPSGGHRDTSTYNMWLLAATGLSNWAVLAKTYFIEHRIPNTRSTLLWHKTFHFNGCC